MSVLGLSGITETLSKNSRWRPLENHDVISTSCHFVSLFHIDDLNGEIFGNPTHLPSFFSVAWLLLELTAWIVSWYFHWLTTKICKSWYVFNSSKSERIIQPVMRALPSNWCTPHWAVFLWKPFCLCFQWITSKLTTSWTTKLDATTKFVSRITIKFWLSTPQFVRSQLTQQKKDFFHFSQGSNQIKESRSLSIGQKSSYISIRREASARYNFTH